MAHRDGDLLVGDQVFKLQLGALVENLRAPRVAVLVANLFEFLHDDGAQLGVAGQNRFVLGNALAHLLQLVEQLVDGELRQAIELQFEDGVDLAEREALFFVRQALAVELDDDLAALAPRVQVLARLGPRARCANDLDDRVEVVERNLEAFEDVLALAGLAQQKDRAPLHHIDAMIDEGLDRLVEPQLPRLPVEHREEDHGEALLHLRVLVELVEHNLRLRAALELDHDPHAVAIALVAHVADVVDDLFVDQLGDALDQLGLVHLVGNLGDDDRLLFLGQVFKRGLGAHQEAAAAGLVGLRECRSCRRGIRRSGSPAPARA